MEKGGSALDGVAREGKERKNLESFFCFAALLPPPFRHLAFAFSWCMKDFISLLGGEKSRESSGERAWEVHPLGGWQRRRRELAKSKLAEKETSSERANSVTPSRCCCRPALPFPLFFFFFFGFVDSHQCASSPIPFFAAKKKIITGTRFFSFSSYFFFL